MTVPVQRLDKWLWFTRLVKTRSLASRLVSAGKIRINRAKAVKPAQTIREGDVITATLNRSVRILKVIALGHRRGPATEAQQLYEDMTPQETENGARLVKHNSGSRKSLDQSFLKSTRVAERKNGTGRPTKRDRRKIRELQQKI